MAEHLSREDVLRIAELARLTLTESEVELFARQLGDILQWVEDIRQADTSGVPPTAHVAPLPTAWRDDTPAASIARDEALAGAPDAAVEAGLFRVPKVL